MTENIVISKTDFKALSSDTRTDILKLLLERNYNLSELSKKLELSNPTVKQHLDVLANATLIEQIDEGRKWKYYSLTKKGKNIFQEEPKYNFTILLSISSIVFVFLLFSLVSMQQISVISEIVPQAAAAPDPDRTKSLSGESAAIPTIQQADEIFERDTVPAKQKANPLMYPLLLTLLIFALIEGFLLAKVFR